MATFKKVREIQFDRTCVLEVDISEKGITRTCNKKPKWRSVEKWKFVKSVSLSKSLVGADTVTIILCDGPGADEEYDSELTWKVKGGDGKAIRKAIEKYL